MKNEIHLVAFYAAQPRDPKKTKIKGYMKDPANLTYSERIAFTRKLVPQDRLNGRVILNLTTKTVVKNTFNPTAEFDEVVKYYCEAYPSYMKEVGFTLEEIVNESDVQTVSTEEETGSKP